MPLQHYSPPPLPPPLMFQRIPLPFTFDEQFDIPTGCCTFRQGQGPLLLGESQAGSALPHSTIKSPSEVLIQPSQDIPKTPLPIDLSNPKRKESDNVFVSQQQGAFSPHLPVTLLNSLRETRYNQEPFNDQHIMPEPISSKMRSENSMELGSGSSHLADCITGVFNTFSTGNRNSKSETVYDETFTVAKNSRQIQRQVSHYNRQNTIALLKVQLKERSKQNLNIMQAEIPRNGWLGFNNAMEYENMGSCVDQERKHLGLESSRLRGSVYIDSPQSIKSIISPAEVPINPCQHVSSRTSLLMDLSSPTQGRSANVFVNQQIRAFVPHIQHLPVTMPNSPGETKCGQQTLNKHHILPKPIIRNRHEGNSMVLGSGVPISADHVASVSSPLGTVSRNSKLENAYDDTFTMTNVSGHFQERVSKYNRRRTIALLKAKIKERSQQLLNSKQAEISRKVWVADNNLIDYENVGSNQSRKRKHPCYRSSKLPENVYMDSPHSEPIPVQSTFPSMQSSRLAHYQYHTHHLKAFKMFDKDDEVKQPTSSSTRVVDSAESTECQGNAYFSFYVF